MATTNSSTTNTFTARVRRQLTDLRTSVDGTLADMEVAETKAAADLRTKRDAAQSGLEARRRDIDTANAQMKAGMEARADAAEAKEKATVAAKR